MQIRLKTFIFVLLIGLLVACGNNEVIDRNPLENEVAENSSNTTKEEQIVENEHGGNENSDPSTDFVIEEITVEDKEAEKLAGIEDKIKFAIKKMLLGEVDDEFIDFISERDKKLVTEEFDFDTVEELNDRYVELFTPLSEQLHGLVNENGNIIKLESGSAFITSKGSNPDHLSLQLDMNMIFENETEEEIVFVFDITENEDYEFAAMFLYNEMD